MNTPVAPSQPSWIRRQLVARLPRRTANRVIALRDRRLPVRVLVSQRLGWSPLGRKVATRTTQRRIGDPTLRPALRYGRTYLAKPLETARLKTVTAQNLALVVDVIEDLGLDHFLVDNRSHTRTAVAVHEADRARLLAAMRERWHDRAVYVVLAREGVRSFERPVLARQALGLPGADASEVLRIFEAYSAGSQTIGEDRGCDVEFWRADDDSQLLIAPRENRVAPSVPMDAPPLRVTVGDRDYRSLEPFAVKTPTDIDFPIDIVYTWVDGSDPEWIKRRDQYLGHVSADLNDMAANVSRYLSRDELRFSLRSVEMFAPWVRRIFIVTDDQVPPWLDQDNDRVCVVSHRQIFTDPSVLPTFNSHAIESQLHHIDGLSEHYIYFNDDMLLGRPVTPGLFFHANGLSKVFLSPARIDYGEATREDAPVMAAAKNNRSLILKDFGRYLTQKQKHTPYPHRRSIMAEMEERYSEDFRRTSASRFRHPSDVSIASSLQQYYSFLTGRAVPASVAYSYVDIAEPRAASQLARLRLVPEFDTFCLNDTDTGPVDLETQLTMVQSFFHDYFPRPSSFERPDVPPDEDKL